MAGSGSCPIYGKYNYTTAVSLGYAIITYIEEEEGQGCTDCGGIITKRLTCSVCGYEVEACDSCYDDTSDSWADWWETIHFCGICQNRGTVSIACKHGYTWSHYVRNETCVTCNGAGTVSKTGCSHGKTSAHYYCSHYSNTTLTSHSYCSHGQTSQHL